MAAARKTYSGFSAAKKASTAAWQVRSSSFEVADETGVTGGGQGPNQS